MPKFITLIVSANTLACSAFCAQDQPQKVVCDRSAPKAVAILAPHSAKAEADRPGEAADREGQAVQHRQRTPPQISGQGPCSQRMPPVSLALRIEAASPCRAISSRRVA